FSLKELFHVEMLKHSVGPADDLAKVRLRRRDAGVLKLRVEDPHCYRRVFDDKPQESCRRFVACDNDSRAHPHRRRSSGNQLRDVDQRYWRSAVDTDSGNALRGRWSRRPREQREHLDNFRSAHRKSGIADAKQQKETAHAVTMLKRATPSWRVRDATFNCSIA